MIGVARTILRKDLLIELRTKESVPAMVLFSITVYVLFHFGLDRDSLDGELASGVLWVTLLLAAVIGVSRLFAAEREQGGIDGLLLAPVDRTALFVAKAAALFVFLTAVELVAVPAFALLLLGPGLGGVAEAKQGRRPAQRSPRGLGADGAFIFPSPFLTDGSSGPRPDVQRTERVQIEPKRWPRRESNPRLTRERRRS